MSEMMMLMSSDRDTRRREERETENRQDVRREKE